MQKSGKLLQTKIFDRWHFPNVFTAGDRIMWLCFNLMEVDQNFINTKGFTVLALVDYDYKFIYIDVGCQDRISDGGVFNNSTSKEAILNNSFSLPPPKPLPILEETDIVWDNDTAIYFIESLENFRELLRVWLQRGLSRVQFQTYLKNRKQFVSISNSTSNTKEITTGVPLGSVLGPLLFLLYINDLHRSVKHSKTYHFADKTNIMQSNKSLDVLSKNLNKDLKSLSSCLKQIN